MTDEAEHDHDHDHEVDPAERELAERDVARMHDALAALDDDALGRSLAGMTEKSRGELAALLNLPRATMRLGDALVPLVRRKLRSASADRELQATFTLAERANDTTMVALGDRSDDPSREDLLEVLPGIIDAHGPALVTVLLAGYAASDAPCREVMRGLLDDDERFAIGPPVEVEEPPSAVVAAPAPVVDQAALDEKREQRRAAKEAKRQAEVHAREARRGAEAKRRAALHEAKRKSR